nr:DUF3772 domain-containing protein [Jannaschia sp. Os4]
MRADLSGTRDRLRDAEGFEAARRDTLRGQIAALGEPPAEGEEDLDIAARRSELQGELERVSAPARRAEAERVEVEALIAEIDARVEAERRAELLRQEVSPVSPSLWWPALGALGAWVAAMGDDVAAVATPDGYARLAANATEVGILFFVAVLLLARSRDWLGRLQRRFVDADGADPQTRLIVAGTGLAQLVLPVAGLFAVTRLARLAGVDGPTITPVLTALPALGALVLAARWIGAQSFPARAEAHPLPDSARAEARFHATLLGLWLALHRLLRIAAETRPDIAETVSVPVLVLVFLAGLSLLRLGRLLARAPAPPLPGDGEAETGDAAERGLVQRAIVLLGRAAMAVGIAGPVLAALGYVNAATYLTWPAVVTLGLIGLVALLQTVIFDVWAAATGRVEAARDALIPTLIAFGLVLAALPLLALIWGVRVETLGEWWRGFLDGIAVGQTRISPAAFLTFAIVFAVGYLLTRAVQAGLRTSVLPKTKLDAGGTNAILSGTAYVGITLAALIAITSAGIDLSGLALVAGALSVGLGFGLQNIVQNFVSGIILLIERPIKIGDWVAVGTTEGFVRAISVRSTRIETFDRQDVIVPNADLIAQAVVNNTLGSNSGRVLIPVGVAYGSDTRRVQAIIEEVCAEHPMVVLNPPPVVTFEAFGASSLDFLARCVLRDVLWKPIVGSDIRHALAERFAAEGIEVPFPQQDVWLRNPEALRPEASE